MTDISVSGELLKLNLWCKFRMSGKKEKDIIEAK